MQVGETFVLAMSSWSGRRRSLRSGEKGHLHIAIIAAVFPIIFVGELPDKTMFASLGHVDPGQALGGVAGCRRRIRSSTS